MKSSSLLAGLAFGAGLLTFAMVAQGAPAVSAVPAKTAAKPSAKPAAAPDAAAASTAATQPKQIGHWFVHCTGQIAAYPCEMFYSYGNTQTGQRLLGVSFAFVPSANQTLMLIAVPLGVSLGKGAILQTDAYSTPTLRYHYCNTASCFVMIPIDNTVLDLIGHAGPSASVKVIEDATGKSFDLPLSLDGFTAARDWMVDQAKQKVKAGAPAQADATPPATPAP